MEGTDRDAAGWVDIEVTGSPPPNVVKLAGVLDSPGRRAGRRLIHFVIPPHVSSSSDAFLSVVALLFDRQVVASFVTDPKISHFGDSLKSLGGSAYSWQRAIIANRCGQSGN